MACDGAASPLRKMPGLVFEGEVFKDSFLIADMRMTADFPTECWFWFDPPSKSGASQLLHKQPDGVWRIDFQIGWDADRTQKMKEANIRRRVADMIGHDIEFDLVWSSIHTFQCRRITRFHQSPVFFASDAAHQVSPFGARGANSGLQDAENLAWKLKLGFDGAAPLSLLDTYDAERSHGASENIHNLTRATDFITPKTQVSHVFHDAMLTLARDHDFARPFANSGRLSVPCPDDGAPSNSAEALAGGPTRILPFQPGQPRQSAWIERYNRTARREWLNQYTVESTGEAQNHATQWLWPCDTPRMDRPNMSIGGITPAAKLKMAA